MVLLIALVLCEVGLRVSDIDFPKPLIGVGHRTVELGLFEPHSTRFWRLTPSCAQTEVNAQGFRGPDLYEKKTNNAYKIFCLGNSCTFGVGCPYESTYPARLQQMFDTAFGQGTVEVINAGVPGYSSLQELRYLKENILGFDPDMLIVQYGENDGEGGNNHRQSFSGFFLRAHPILLKSEFYQTMYGLYFGFKKFFYDQSKTYREKVERASLWDCYNNLKEIEKCAWRSGIKTFFITPTWCLEGKLFQLSGWSKNPRIDIFSVLSASGHAPSSLYYDDHHWSPAGHNLVAKAIYSKIYPAVVAGLQDQER